MIKQSIYRIEEPTVSNKTIAYIMRTFCWL